MTNGAGIGFTPKPHAVKAADKHAYIVGLLVIVRLPEQLDNAEYYKKVLDAGVDGIFMDNFDLLDAYLENQPQNFNAMPETQNESG